MADTKSTEKESPERAAAREAAAKIRFGGEPGEDPVRLYSTEDRHHAHLVLEELRARYPQAECREPGGVIEVWSGPAGSAG